MRPATSRSGVRSSTAQRGVWTRRAALTAAALLSLAAPAWAQQGKDQPGTQPPQRRDGAPATVAGVGRTVAVEASGGPASLQAEVSAAIQAWKRAAPNLVDLSIDKSAGSTLRYAPPALLGPDTYSIDLRTPGDSAITVEVAPTAVTDRPMVLLHEVGVLLGLPEGEGDVMAYAVPAGGAPQAPSSSDVNALQEQRTFAPEDLNHDGVVDFYDLVLFGQDFGAQGVNLPADFDHDGRVDGRDLDLLRKAYTFSPPSQTAPGPHPAAPAGGPSDQGSPGGTTPDNGGSAQGGTSPPASSNRTTSPTAPDGTPGGGQ